MINFLRKRVVRKVSVVLLLVLIFEGALPLYTYALTNGPTAPEVTSFEPAGANKMVDLFTGDFTYNIDLFELPGPNGGYPFNIAYHAGVGMETEASWVGLGWNINPGAINRTVRGVPDDFKGDRLITKNHMASNWTVGVGLGANSEVMGGDFGANLNRNFGVYYNSYRGLGYNTSLSIGAQYCKTNGNKLTGGMGINVDLGFDSQTGFSFSPSLSAVIHKENDENKCNGTIGMGITMSSMRGLQNVSFSSTFSGSKKDMACNAHVENLTNEERERLLASNADGGILGSTSINFASTAFSPSIGSEMSGSNLDISFKIGGTISGIMTYGSFKGYYSEQHLRYNDQDVSTPLYGYLHYGTAPRNAVMDFNREKDAMIRPETPNLPIPSLTHDMYSISGQGVGASFRPYRAEVGTVYDREISSSSTGATASGDFAFGNLAQFGFDIGLNGTSTKSVRWEPLGHPFNFSSEENLAGENDEKVYFGIAGEPTSDLNDQFNHIGDESAVHLGFMDMDDLQNKYYTNNDASVSTPGQLMRPKGLPEFHNSKRKPRVGNILPLTNDELSDNNNSDPILKEFNIKYYSKPGLQSAFPTNNTDRLPAVDDLSRTSLPKAHIGGYSTLDGTGNRYIYGLPVYNLNQTEDVRSVIAEDHTIQDNIVTTIGAAEYKDPKTKEEYLDRKTTPAYASSYLLTSILGNDYIDVDNNGPSDEDFGYWVKFNYVKVADSEHPYGWRAPYEGYNFMQGYRSKTSDDKVSSTYGEREVYYLASAETKTHIAVFEITPREDGLSANSKETNTTHSQDLASFKLSKITLYSKDEYYYVNSSNQLSVNPDAVPIQSVNFAYNYSLCPGIKNSNTHSGKLTLSQIAFTYENSTRGSLAPYKFEYYNSGVQYNPLFQNRWGNYQPYPHSWATNKEDYDFPYVYQTNDPYISYNSQQRIADASEWNLKKITTPSGSQISVEYEPDDYAYVQHRDAAQMFKIAGFYDDANEVSGDIGNSRIYTKGAWNNDAANCRKLIFKLERPTSDLNELARYFRDLNSLDGRRQIYFKALMDLRSHEEAQANAALKEYVSGYLDINSYGFYPENGTGPYDYAYIELAKIKIGSESPDGHPMSVMAWDFLRTSVPDLATAPGNLGSGDVEGEAKARQLLSFVTHIANVFRGYYKNCRSKEWAQYADLDHSVIRLNSPDGVKYGGDIRVKSIKINNGWNFGSETESEYGVNYDYTTQEKDANGVVRTISSGVAQYEPILGGDEIALRYAKRYSQTIPLHVDDSYIVEYPLNEGYYPCAQVGYSKVTATSLATKKQLDAIANNASEDDEFRNLMGTGVTVNEFYTAKDFPVITEETNLRHDKDGCATCHPTKRRVSMAVPIPLIGYTTVDNLTAVQGYKVELNNMHGAAKAVTIYPQNTNGKVIWDQPVSSVKYNYSCEPFIIDGKIAFKLKNSGLKVLTGEGLTESRTVATEEELFNDLRCSSTISGNGGVAVNLDVIVNALPFVFPPVWPSLGYAEQTVKLAVTNKIIRKSGILSSIEASDGLSRSITKNEIFDGLTGRPLLTSVTNSYGDPVYNYKIPARWYYPNMGPAFENLGYTFVLGLTNTNCTGLSGRLITITLPSILNKEFDNLKEGDELRIRPINGASGNANAIVVKAASSLSGQPAFITLDVFEDAALSQQEYSFTVVRSGARNLVNIDAGNVQTLRTSPLVNRSYSVCSLSGSTSTIYPSATDYVGFYQRLLNLLIIWYNEGQPLSPDFSIRSTDAEWNSLIGGLNVNFDGIKYYNGSSTFTFLSNGAELISPCSPEPNLIQQGGTYDSPITGNKYYLSAVHDFTYSLNNGIIQISFTAEYTPPAGVQSNSLPSSVQTIEFPMNSGCLLNLSRVNNCSELTIQKINNVLNTSACTFSDAWNLNFNSTQRDDQASADLKNNSIIDPYSTGEKGIWRVNNTYAYVDDRKQTIGNGGDPMVNTRMDGTFDNMPLFPWDNPFGSKCGDFSNWRKANSTLTYTPYNYPAEDKNILDVHSSALYGNKGKSSLAVSGNASLNAVGVEDFEDYYVSSAAVPTHVNNDINQITNQSGNLDFVPKIEDAVFSGVHTGALTVYDQYDVLYAHGDIAILDKPYNSNDDFTTAGLVKVNAISGPNLPQWSFESLLGYCLVSAQSAATTNDGPEYVGKTKITLRLPDGTSKGPGFALYSDDRCWKGIMYVPRTLSAAIKTYDNVSFDATKAHTGKVSLKLIGDATFDQKEIKLDHVVDGIPKYLFSSWVSLENQDVPTYAAGTAQPFVEILFYDKTGTLVGTSPQVYPSGAVIEGWQKVEGEVSVPNNADYVAIRLGRNGTGISSNWDDIRFHPYQASFKSYVYSKSNYRLLAVLDDNNYASLYSYDEQGNLYLVRKETQNGIMTIQESRQHVKE